MNIKIGEEYNVNLYGYVQTAKVLSKRKGLFFKYYICQWEYISGQYGCGKIKEKDFLYKLKTKNG